MLKKTLWMGAIRSIIFAFLRAGQRTCHGKTDRISSRLMGEQYTVKVPVEKDNATIKVVLSMPDGVEFQQYEPVPGGKQALKPAKTKK